MRLFIAQHGISLFLFKKKQTTSEEGFLFPLRNLMSVTYKNNVMSTAVKISDNVKGIGIQIN